MKNLKTIITVIALSLSTVFSVSANDTKKNEKPSTVKNNLRTEIVSLLGNEIPVEIKKESTAEVSFIVNKDNELIVVSVDSEVTAFNSFVKNKLNYKKVSVKGIKKGEIYKMPMKIKRSK